MKHEKILYNIIETEVRILASFVKDVVWWIFLKDL